MYRALFGVASYLSVCLSVSLAYCFETTENVIKQSTMDCSPVTLVSHTERNIEQVYLTDSHILMWQFGLVVMALVTSTRLLYVELG